MKKYLLFKKINCTLFLWFGIICFYSCNPELEKEFPYLKRQVVVDGWIEVGNYTNVLLTYNAQYFSVIDSASFKDYIALYAKVTVSDGVRSEVLTRMRTTNYFPPVIYRGTEIRGEIGKTYKLLVENLYDTLTAYTQILQPVVPDSIWFEPRFAGDTLGLIKGILSDNINEKNYYRTFTSIQNKDKIFIPTLISCFDDKYFNGKKFTFSLRQGPETYLKPIKNVYFKRGDTILVKVSRIDKASYDFWMGYENEIINSGNPFAASHTIIYSNINGGLGVWCGYGSSYYTVVAK